MRHRENDSRIQGGGARLCHKGKHARKAREIDTGPPNGDGPRMMATTPDITPVQIDDVRRQSQWKYWMRELTCNYLVAYDKAWTECSRRWRTRRGENYLTDFAATAGRL
jgi:hypothetical protein